MPISLIPIIARTNTIDEWRIQTNASATDLNDLGFYTYDKDQGTLVLSNTSILNITAEGTPLQVANNVLFSKNLTLGNNLILGVQSSGTGNIIAGSTVSVRGPGRALSVSNNSFVGVDLEVTRSVYTGNVYANNNMTVGDDLTVDGILTLPGTGEVLIIEDGIADINNISAITTTSTNVATDNLYAAFARIDVLDDLAFARIGILENTTGNSYYLSSNSHTSNSISTRYITANISGNIVRFTSDTSNINSATILSGNIVSLTSNSSSLNVTTINTSTILNSNTINLVSQNVYINVVNINVSTTNTSTTLNANIVILVSNSSLINVATVNTANITWLTSSNTINANTIVTKNLEVSTINVDYVNVSSNIWVESGGTIRVSSPDENYETVTIDGKITLANVYVRDDIVVEGTWTQLGEVKYEVNEITLNSETPLNADATFRNYRPIGDPALIRWNETLDQWTISKGNTYNNLFGILDASFLDATVTSNNTSNVATPSAVKAAFETAQFAGGYANTAYEHANAAYVSQNTTGNYANSAYLHANAAYVSQNTTGVYANTAYEHANAAYVSQNTTGVYANAAYAVANSISALSGLSGKFAESLVLNSGQDQDAVPLDTMTSALIVDRGSRANVEIKWVEKQSIDVRVRTGTNPTTGDPVFETQTNASAGPNWIFTRNGTNYQNVGSAAAESYSNSAFTIANTALVEAESAKNIAQSADTRSTSNRTILNDLRNNAGNIIKSVNIIGGAANRILYQTGADTTNFIVAADTDKTVLTYNTTGGFSWKTIPNSLIGESIEGDLTVTGRLNTGNVRFNTDGTAFLQGSKIVLNGNQIQNQGPSLDAVIEVDRGTSANAIFRYVEEIDRWQYTHDGSNFATLGFSATRANNIQGGAANRIPVQSEEHVTTFIAAPSAANYYLKWTGSAFEWSAVPIPDLATAKFNADQINAGTLASARLSGDYAINITGSAGSAATAASATTATTATTATNATNVTSGGSIDTGAIKSDGKGEHFGKHVFKASGTTTSRLDPNETASVKVVGDIAVSNDVWATFFRGTATAALYADLAEKYLADKKYPAGTIMMIGGKKEITAAKSNKKHAIIGIVSEKPAYIMNSDLKNGTMVGLKGRLPIRLIGKCEKGDLITISDKPGVGQRTNEMSILPFRIIALQNKETEEEELIEVFIT